MEGSPGLRTGEGGLMMRNCFCSKIVFLLLAFFLTASASLASVDGARIKEIIILGNTRTNKEVIRRQLPFVEGDYWRNEFEDLTYSRIQDMNCFDPMTLRITTEPLSGGEIRVVVRVSDPHILYFDPLEFLLFKLQDLLHQSYSQIFYNPFGTGLNLSAGGGWGANPWFSLGFKQSLQDGWLLRGKLQWFDTTRRFYPFNDPPQYHSSGFSTSISFNRHATGVWQYGGLLNYSPVRVALDGAGEVEQAYLSIGSDFRWLKPVEFNLAFRYSLDLAGNFPSYPSVTAGLTRSLSVGGGNQLLSSLYGGYMPPFAPLNRLYAIGGFGHVPIRGFSQSFTGHIYFVTSLEYRHSLPGNIWLLAFVDRGRMWSEHDKTSDYDWEIGAGLGLAVDTPLGYPFRVDFAYGLTGETGLAWRMGLDLNF